MKSIRKEIGSEAGAAVPASVHTRETAPAPALKREYHGFGPVYDGHSRILILGSFPSVKSRAQNFYYGHPQNRFWPVLAAVFGEAVPDEIDAKRAFVLRHGIALWDVLESCEIRGSSDASIRGAVPVEIGTVTGAGRIGTIFVNGGTAKKYYDRYLKALTGSEAVRGSGGERTLTPEKRSGDEKRQPGPTRKYGRKPAPEDRKNDTGVRTR